MTLGRIVAALAGLALALFLVLNHGLEGVTDALRIAGWGGLGAITAFHALPIALCGVAWWLLLRKATSESWLCFTWVRWIRDGIDGVLPILPVSGELVGGRILALRGVPRAGASIVIDLTAELLSQALFALISLGLLIAAHPHAPYLTWIALGIAVMAVEFVGFLIAQRKGLLRLIERPIDWLRRRRSTPVTARERSAHDDLLAIYQDGPAFLGCILLHLVAWLVGAAEAWIGLALMGHPLGVADTLALEGLVYALRSVAFFVPLGAGIQEGGYIVIGGILGLPPDISLAVSLLKRGRDLLLGVPAMLVWQMIEGRTPRPSSEA